MRRDQLREQRLVLRERAVAAHQPVSNVEPQLDAQVEIGALHRRRLAHIDGAHGHGALLIQLVVHPNAQPAGVEADLDRLCGRRGGVVLIRDDAAQLHQVELFKRLDLKHGVALPLANCRGVIAHARNVDAPHDRLAGRQLDVAVHGRAYQLGGYDCLVVRARELPHHLDQHHIAVDAILLDHLLEHLGVGALDVAGVDLVLVPERRRTVEALIKGAGVAARVGERKPEAVRRRLGKEALADRVDRLRYAGAFVKYQHHAIGRVDTGECVGHLLRPELGLRVVVAAVDIHVALDSLAEPRRRLDGCGRAVEPVAVDRHGHPLADLRPRPRSELLVGVGRNDHRRAEAGRQHPMHQPAHQRRLADAATACDSRAEHFRVEAPAIARDMRRYFFQHLGLPLSGRLVTL